MSRAKVLSNYTVIVQHKLYTILSHDNHYKVYDRKGVQHTFHRDTIFRGIQNNMRHWLGHSALTDTSFALCIMPLCCLTVNT